MRTSKIRHVSHAILRSGAREAWVRLRRETSGQDLVEYAMVVGMIAVLIGAMLPSQVVPALQTIWDAVATPLGTAATNASS